MSDKATERLTLRLTPAEASIIDTHRGSLSRSAYLRGLLDDVVPQEVPEPSEQPAVTRMRERTDPEFTPDPEDVALQEAPTELPEQVDVLDGHGNVLATYEKPVVPDVRAHLHYRVKGERVGFDKGVPLYAYTCKEPGCHWTSTAR